LEDLSFINRGPRSSHSVGLGPLRKDPHRWDQPVIPVGSLHDLEMMLIAGALRQELRQGRIS
jgi:hypothetical protein